MKKYLFFIYLVLYCSILYTQEDSYILANLNFEIKSGATTTYYYGFDKNDEVIISFDELKGKDLRSIEFVKFPSNILYSTFKSNSINDLKIRIIEQGVYFLRLHNSSMGRRRCNLVVKRIPFDDSSECFNTTVYWKNISDTVYKEYTKKVLVKHDTVFVDVIKKDIPISAGKNNKEIFQVLLPDNTLFWTYYIGADQESKEDFENTVINIIKTSSKYYSTVNPSSAVFTEVACKGLSTLKSYTKKRNVWYCFSQDYNSVLNYLSGQPSYCLRRGNVSLDHSTIYSSDPKKFFIGLLNDNAIFSIDAFVRIYAAVEVKEYKNEKFIVPQIKEYRVPYLEN